MIYIVAMVVGALIMLVGVLVGSAATDIVSRTTLSAVKEANDERPDQ